MKVDYPTDQPTLTINGRQVNLVEVQSTLGFVVTWIDKNTGTASRDWQNFVFSDSVGPILAGKMRVVNVMEMIDRTFLYWQIGEVSCL